MRLFKQIAALAACLGILLSLWGCGGRELYERLLIHGIGVDADGEDGFLVTVRSSSSTEEGGEEFFECRGATVLEALDSLTLSTGRRPFYAHNYLVVFGEDCARLGLDRCIDFFVRYYNTRPAVRVFLAQGEAAEVLSCQKDGKYLKMSQLQQLGENGWQNGHAAAVELLDFINGVKREGSSPVMPVLKAREGAVELVSTGYFDGYQLKGFLPISETRGWLAAGHGLKGGQAVVEGEDFGQVTLSLSGSPGRIEAAVGPDGLPVFQIVIEVQGDVSALDRGRDRLEDDFYPRVEEELAALLKSETESALAKTVRQDRCDIFGLGNLLYQTEPEYWRAHGDDWKELMAQCACTVTVSAKVKRLEQEALDGLQ